MMMGSRRRRVIGWRRGDLGAYEAGGTDLAGGGGQEETCGRGDGPSGAGEWAAETRAVSANCEVQDSAFSIAQGV